MVVVRPDPLDLLLIHGNRIRHLPIMLHPIAPIMGLHSPGLPSQEAIGVDGVDRCLNISKGKLSPKVT